MKTLTLLLVTLSSLCNADEHTVNLGLFTEHYERDRSYYNENNHLVQYMYKSDNDYVYTAATFKNSYFIRSHMIGAGYEWADTIGAYLAVIEGYGSVLNTHHDGLLVVPILYLDTFGFRHTVMGTAYNLGITVEF